MKEIGKIDLPDGWAVARFDLLFDNVTSSKLKLPQKKYLESGKYPVIDQGQEIVGGYTDDNDLLHPGTPPSIVFGDHTRCLKYIDFKFVQGADGVKVLSPSSQIYSTYSYYLLKTADLPDKGYSRHFKYLKECDFRFAPLNEQKRIVAKIEQLQKRSRRAKKALESVPELLDQLRQSILAAAFRGNLTRKWREQNPDVEPATELLKRIRTERRKRWEAAELEKLKAKGLTGDKLDAQFAKQRKKYKEPEPVDTTDLPELPEGWCWASADELTQIITDGEHQTPPRTNNGIPLLSARNIQNGWLSLENVDYVSAGVYDDIKKRLEVRGGDILMSCSGSLGRTCVVEQGARFAMVRSVALLRPVLTSMGKFLSLAIMSPFLQYQIDAKKTQTAQANIFQNKIRTLVFPVPTLEEQKKIFEFVSDTLKRQGNLVNELGHIYLKRLHFFDQAILYKAFRGELVPQDPNDEPASILLERIRREKNRQTDAQKAKKKKKRGRNIGKVKA